MEAAAGKATSPSAAAGNVKAALASIQKLPSESGPECVDKIFKQDVLASQLHQAILCSKTVHGQVPPDSRGEELAADMKELQDKLEKLHAQISEHGDEIINLAVTKLVTCKPAFTPENCAEAALAVKNGARLLSSIGVETWSRIQPSTIDNLVSVLKETGESDGLIKVAEDNLSVEAFVKAASQIHKLCAGANAKAMRSFLKSVSKEGRASMIILYAVYCIL